ncbi:MAG: GlsB/YeaQ/YmgE family stress response membrane protein [Ktedonobacterales bacterium]|nr:GlsB/YeaQ/YmgE family stress response membrane protein [Ktedonobacterales bacterium]
MVGTVIAWIVVGGIAGWLANVAVRGVGFGVVGDILVGIIGGIIGGIVVSALGGPGVTGLNFWSIVVAFAGAVILLVLMRLIGVSPRDTTHV